MADRCRKFAGLKPIQHDRDQTRILLDAFHDRRIEFLSDPALVHAVLGENNNDCLRLADALCEDLSHQAVAWKHLPPVDPDIQSSRPQLPGEWQNEPLLIFARMTHEDLPRRSTALAHPRLHLSPAPSRVYRDLERVFDPRTEAALSDKRPGRLWLPVDLAASPTTAPPA